MTIVMEKGTNKDNVGAMKRKYKQKPWNGICEYRTRCCICISRINLYTMHIELCVLLRTYDTMLAQLWFNTFGK